jgi:hypothetical protein
MNLLLSLPQSSGGVGLEILEYLGKLKFPLGEIIDECMLSSVYSRNISTR